MKRVIYSNQTEAYNYGDYIIQHRPEGWCVLEYPTYQIVAGPFYTWYDAQVHVDENLND